MRKGTVAMNFKKKILCGVCAAILLTGVFFTGHYAGAASKTPGSVGDPLVTLGYLEGRLAQTTGLSQKVQLSKGQKLVGETGTQVIVLKGSVIAAGGGLVDLTSGSLAEGDTSMFLYHNYIVSENGSGCEALATCTLLVCGEYEVK